MKNIKITILSVSLLLLFISCKQTEYDAFSTITGTVIDSETSQPISAASVNLSPTGKSVYTGSDGYFQFESLDAGQYTITVQKQGYSTNRKTVNAISGETESVSITLTKSN